MAKSRRILLFIAVALLLSFSPALAVDTLHLTTLPSATAGGNYVGFVGGYLNNNQPAYNYLCIDYDPKTYVPGDYLVNVSSFDTLANVKFRDSSGNPLLAQYKQAAWLLYQMIAHPEATAAIQYAIWNIFTSSAPDYTGQEYWLNLAQNTDFSNFDFSHVRIYSPTDLQSTSQQEFMAIAPVPPAVWLLGTGLIGLIGIRRRFTA